MGSQVRAALEAEQAKEAVKQEAMVEITRAVTVTWWVPVSEYYDMVPDESGTTFLDPIVRRPQVWQPEQIAAFEKHRPHSEQIKEFLAALGQACQTTEGEANVDVEVFVAFPEAGQ